MKDWERRMWGEVKELRAINDDVKALQAHLWERQSDITIPDWITSPEMRDEALQLLTFAEKYMTFDIRETKLLPTPA